MQSSRFRGKSTFLSGPLTGILVRDPWICVLFNADLSELDIRSSFVINFRSSSFFGIYFCVFPLVLLLENKNFDADLKKTDL